jgi:excisionase family DNA binding protein
MVDNRLAVVLGCDKKNKMNKSSKMNRKHKDYFTPPEVAELTHVSSQTVKRWLEKKLLKGYRVGPSGHWRILLPDLVVFMQSHGIPIPLESEIGFDLEQIYEEHERLIRCYEFFGRNRRHVVPSQRRKENPCEGCLVFRVGALACYALREEVDHRKLYCVKPCEECEYYRFVTEGMKRTPNGASDL